MSTLSLDQFGPKVQALLKLAADQKVPSSLAFGDSVSEAKDKLDGLKISDLASGKDLIEPDYADCLLAGLWLRFDFMTESHTLSQGIKNASGSYWHGILHRREPDAGNARYWFSRVAEHPAFETLAREADLIAQKSSSKEAGHFCGAEQWDPDHFISLCTHPQDDVTTQLLLDIQIREWEVLFEYDFQTAFGEELNWVAYTTTE